MLGATLESPLEQEQPDEWQDPLADPILRQDYMQLLASTLIFAESTTTFCSALVDSVKLVEVATDEAVFRQGDDADWLCIIVAGRVDLVMQRQGATVPLGTKQVSDVIGDLGFFGIESKRSHGAVAAVPSKMLRLTRESFDRVVAVEGWPPSLSGLQDSHSVQRIMEDLDPLTRLCSQKGLDTGSAMELHSQSVPQIAYENEVLTYDLGSGEFYMLVHGRAKIEKEGALVAELTGGLSVMEVPLIVADQLLLATVTCQTACLLRMLRMSPLLADSFQKANTWMEGLGSDASDTAAAAQGKGSEARGCATSKRKTVTMAAKGPDADDMERVRVDETKELPSLKAQQKWNLHFKLPRKGGYSRRAQEEKKEEKDKEEKKEKKDKEKDKHKEEKDREKQKDKEMDKDKEKEAEQEIKVAVIDPPCSRVGAAPFYASEAAGLIANIMLSRAVSAVLPGRTLRGKSVAAIGKDCLAAGLLTAALGGKVALVSERRHVQDAHRNVRMHLSSSFDVSKSGLGHRTLTAVSSGIGNSAEGLSGEALCEKLNVAPPLDLALISASVLACTSVEYGINFDGLPLFALLNEVVPSFAPTRVLLVCNTNPLDDRNPYQSGKGSLNAGRNSEHPPWLQLPASWQARYCCHAAAGIPVFWLERDSFDFEPDTASKRSVTPLRRYLPPMGSSSSKCGCGGHPQRNFLNHCVVNGEWHKNRARLKEALVQHNQSKQNQTATMLDEARSWATTATRTWHRGPWNAGMSLQQESLESCDFELLDLQELGVAGEEGMPSLSPPIADGEQADTSDDPELAPIRPGPFADSLAAAQAISEGLDTRSRESHIRQPTAPTAARSRDPKHPKHMPRLATPRVRARARLDVKGLTIAERHASPPHWYRCNRSVYG